MIDLDNVKVILKTSEIDDTFLLFHGFKETWYMYDGLPLCVRFKYAPLAISESAIVGMYLEDTTAITTVGLGWQ